MGVTWALVVEGGEAVPAHRVIHCTLVSIDLPPPAMLAALEAAARGVTLVVDVRLVERRPITAGLLRAFAERRGVELVMPTSPEEVHSYAACHAAWARTPARDPAPVARDLRARGQSLGQICQALEHQGYTPPGGGRWWKSTVQQLITRTGTP